MGFQGPNPEEHIPGKWSNQMPQWAENDPTSLPQRGYDGLKMARNRQKRCPTFLWPELGRFSLLYIANDVRMYCLRL